MPRAADAATVLQLIDIVETVYRGASKGRGLVVSPKDYSTRYKYCASLLISPRHRRIWTDGLVRWAQRGVGGTSDDTVSLVRMYCTSTVVMAERMNNTLLAEWASLSKEERCQLYSICSTQEDRIDIG